MSEQSDDQFCRSPAVGHVSKFYQYFSLIEGIIAVLCCVAGLTLWFVHRKTAYLKARNLPAMLIETFGLGLFCLGELFKRWKMKEENFMNRCDTENIALFSALAFMYLGYSLRLFSIFIRRRLVTLLIAFFQEVNVKPARSRAYVSSPWSFRAIPANILAEIPDADIKMKRAKSYRRRLSLKYNFGALTVGFLICGSIFAILVAATCPIWGMVDNCNPDLTYFVGAVFTGVGLLVQSGIFCYLLRFRAFENTDYHDPYGILKELYRHFRFGWPLLVVGIVALSFGVQEPPSDGGQIEFPRSFIFDLNYFWYYFSVVLYPGFIAGRRPDSYYDLSMREVIDHPIGQKLFLLHLINEKSQTNLLGYIAMLDWRRNFDRNIEKANENATVAWNIYRRYLEPTSQSAANVGHANRQGVKDKLDEAERRGIPSDLKFDLFLPVEQELFTLIEHDSWERFKLNGVYQFYMGLSDTLPEQEDD